MARITIEDCLEHVDNRFELVLLGSKRARQLSNGALAQVEWENDKPTVVALREIATGLVGDKLLQTSIARTEDEEADGEAVDGDAPVIVAEVPAAEG